MYSLNFQSKDIYFNESQLIGAYKHRTYTHKKKTKKADQALVLARVTLS